MGGHNQKIIRHYYNGILGHNEMAMLDSKNQNLRANKSFNLKCQFDLLMSNHVDFVKTIQVTFRTILSEMGQVEMFFGNFQSCIPIICQPLFWYWYHTPPPWLVLLVFVGWYCCTVSFSGNTFLRIRGNSFFEKFRGNSFFSSKGG